MDGIQGTYAIAYAGKDGTSFSPSEPWILAEFGDNIEECKGRVIALVNEGFKNVILFQFGKRLLESYSWNYVKRHKVSGEK